MKTEIKPYKALPTIKRFHESPAQIRAVVGPVGSSKTTGAAMEVCYYLPHHLHRHHGITKTRWAVVRNSYRELADTTQRTVFEWFPDGERHKTDNTYVLRYENGIEVELLFRSCDRPDDAKKFKSLEITGYWVDESIEVSEEIIKMLKNRIGRYPPKCPVRFGIHTTNPPEVEHPTYSQFAWETPPPGPVPPGKPLENHVGYWQPPRENQANLRPGYYDDLIRDYAHDPDWVAMYVEGKPGVLVQGKQVYANFRRDRHVALEPLIWDGQPLYRSWDNSGNNPACLVAMAPSPLQVQVLGEFHSGRLGIVDFCERVVAECNQRWPGARFITPEPADPAGEAKFSKRGGGFTSNAELMRDLGVETIGGEQNLFARLQAVDRALARYDGLLLDPSCTRLINGFIGGYCYPEVGGTGEYRDEPLKNKYSHVQDALQYLLAYLAHNQVHDTQPPPAMGRRFEPGASYGLG